MATSSSVLKDLFSAGTSEKEKYEFLKTLYNKKNLPMITDLSLGQIQAVVVLELFDVWVKKNWNFELGIKNNITESYKEHLISKDRLGRKEGVEVLKGEEAELEEPKGFLAKVKKGLGIG